MGGRKVSSSVLLLCLFLYTIIFRLVIMSNYLKYSESINAAAMIFFLFISIALLGFRKDKATELKKNIFTIVLVTIIVTAVLMYFAGVFTGFLKNSYSLAIPSIINNILGPFILVITVELFRYTLLSYDKDNKIVWILTGIVLALFEISYTVKLSDFNTTRSAFLITTTIIIPVIIKNVLLNYLTVYGGYKPTIIYRVVMDLHVYVLPIVPDLGDYINAMKGIIIPIFIYFKCNKTIENYYEYQNKEAKIRNRFSILDIPTILILLILIILVSGYFPVTMIGIGSTSMSPKINKGDAAIYISVKIEDIKKDDIIAYNDGKKTIVHRVTSIKKKDKKVIIRTKGDANNKQDEINISPKDVKGKVIMTIPYIGYPGVLLSEKINKGF